MGFKNSFKNKNKTKKKTKKKSTSDREWSHEGGQELLQY